MPLVPGEAPLPAGEILVEVDALEYEYPPPQRIHALRGITLRISAGEFVAIVGQNGSGKSSLAHCISGYFWPTRGTLRVAGQEIARLRPAQRARLVGHVFQNPDHQLFKERAWDDVAFGLKNLGLEAGAIAATVEEVMRRLELWDKRELHPFQLSKGDRQRLAIAAILAMQPGVLIVDEPTTGQDPARSREIMDLLARLNVDRGTTIIAITHVMELVAEYARRVLVMHSGRILLEGLPRDVFARTEELATTAIAPPPVARLGLSLGLTPLPITVGEGVRTLAQRLVR
jgi:energy-coupling factor transporter ATP-binding protein EcfA2